MISFTALVVGIAKKDTQFASVVCYSIILYYFVGFFILPPQHVPDFFRTFLAYFLLAGIGALIAFRRKNRLLTD